jgi:hypothetical protein
MDVCGEIQYETPEGYIHSDICMIHDGEYNPSDDYRKFVHDRLDNYRKFLHDCLDEWLNESNGTGMFWIGNPEFAVNEFKEQ